MRYLLSLSVLVLFSCSSMKKQAKSGTTGHNTLSGTMWTITSFPDFQMEKTNRAVTIHFSDTASRFGGSTGCNTYGGSYSVDGSKIKMEKVISTQMACMPGMKTESRLLKALETADHYAISGDNLTLLQGDKVLAEFHKSKKEQK